MSYISSRIKKMEDIMGVNSKVTITHSMSFEAFYQSGYIPENYSFGGRTYPNDTNLETNLKRDFPNVMEFLLHDTNDTFQWQDKSIKKTIL